MEDLTQSYEDQSKIKKVALPHQRHRRFLISFGRAKLSDMLLYSPD